MPDRPMPSRLTQLFYRESEEHGVPVMRIVYRNDDTAGLRIVERCGERDSPGMNRVVVELPPEAVAAIRGARFP